MRSSFLPLCRLRGCILHPHAELAIASKGGVPGRGAVAALEAAGPAGSVLVAFENAEGELHGVGVLARVQRVEHTSYGPRYVLRGVTRALVDEAKIHDGDPPRIATELLPERPEDLGPPPARLVATAAELASEWMGLDEWKSAFALLTRSRLGQWATTLCVLMPLDQGERFELLDQPERLDERLQAKLDRLLAVHSRRRTRDAVLKETAPREPTRVEERIVAVPPASNTFLVFHPQDLVHHFGDGPEWWRDPGRMAEELRAGTVFGAATERDDEHLHVRVTSGPLSGDEAARAVSATEFRVEVTRGRLFVGSPRNLPSRVTDLFQRELGVPDGWFDVPRGPWRVTVHALARGPEPPEDEPSHDGTVTGPADYVVRFEPVLVATDVLAAPAIPVMPVGGNVRVSAGRA